MFNKKVQLCITRVCINMYVRYISTKHVSFRLHRYTKSKTRTLCLKYKTSEMLYEHQTNATIIRAIGNNPIRALCTFKAKNKRHSNS